MSDVMSCFLPSIVVYYESRKRDLQTCLMNESRCDERLHDKTNWVTRQNKLEKPRDKVEVNKWGIHESDGRAHDPDTMVAPLTPKPTRKDETLTRTSPTIVLLFIINGESESYMQNLWMSRCDERLLPHVAKKSLRSLKEESKICLLWINKARAKDKRYK
jgi:hypothetical protein